MFIKVVAFYGSAMIVSGLFGAVVGAYKRLDWQHWATLCFFFPFLLPVLFLKARNTGPIPKRMSIDQQQAQFDNQH